MTQDRRTDRRYRTQRWRRVRLRVLERDRHVCRVVVGCTRLANVADHIDPATPDMPDALFFDPANLRAACRGHNLARGLIGDTPPLAGGPSGVVTGDYS